MFVRYTPGHILARLTWYALEGVLQRQRNYAVANTFLRLLLSTPYGFARRGEWWLRLVVNMKHLKDTVRRPTGCSVMSRQYEQAA